MWEAVVDTVAVGEETDIAAVDDIEAIEQIPYSADLPGSTHLQNRHGSGLRAL